LRHPPLGVAAQRGDDGKAVQQMVREHFRRIAHRRQVINLVPLGEQVQVGEQPGGLLLRERQAQRLRACCQFSGPRRGHGTTPHTGRP